MYKKIVPVSSKMSFPDIISDVQLFAHANTRDKLQPFVTQYGVVTKSSNGVATGPELQPTYAHASGINLPTFGKVIFEDNFYIVGANGTNKLVYNLGTVGNNANYQIYIQYTTTQSIPVDVTDGFYYPSGTRNTKQSPSYFLAAAPLASGLASNQVRLASGITDGSGNLDSGAFYDARTPFIMNSEILNEEIAFLLDRNNTYNYFLTLNSGLEVSEGALFNDNVNISGILYTKQFNANYTGSYTALRNVLGYDSDGSTVFMLNETSATLGGQVLRLAHGLRTDAIKAINGAAVKIYNSSDQYVGDVITTGETPTTPQNLRLYDINGDKFSNNDSIVVFKWNYDDVLLSGVSASISGLYTHGTRSFKYDNHGIDDSMTRYETITADSLVGKKLYFPRSGNSYPIAANGAATTASGLQTYILLEYGLSSEDATETQKDPVAVSNYQTPSRIIDDADSYLLTIERVPKDLSEVNDFALNIAQYKNTYILPQEYVLDPKFITHLPTDASYEVKIQAQKKFTYSDVMKLNEDYSNSSIGFSKDQKFDGTDTVTTSFSNPTTYSRYRFSNNVPFDLTGTLSVRGTSFGFNLSIAGYQDSNNPNNNPHDFEIMYTAGSKPDDWTNISTDQVPDVTRLVTESRTISVPTVERKQYHIAVWPRINGSRVVSTPLTKSVTGGAGGVYPDNAVIADTRFSLKTYTVSGISDNVIDASQFVSPVVSGTIHYGLDPQDVLGQVILETSSSLEYRITDAYWYDSNRDKITIEVNGISDGAGSSVSGLCYINTTEAGRRIYESIEMPIDYQLVRASVVIDAGKGVTAQAPGIIRIYQDGLDTVDANAVDYVEINQVPVKTGAWLDETIQGNRTGATNDRTLIIDLYDPNGINNHCNLTGEITVHGTPLVINREGDRPIPNIS